MQRAPIVLSTTALGLVGVLSYHAAAGSSSASLTTTTAGAAKTTTAPSAAAPTPPTTSGKTRTATGSDVSFTYGDLQVKVTMSGTKLTNVQVVQLNVSDPHSAQIDQSAIPSLTQEAIASGSAKINAVSGASYTSQAYTQSLQSAIDKLTSTGRVA